MTALPGETYERVYPELTDLDLPAYVSYGRPHHETCAHHVEHTFNAKRAYILASGSLSKNTDEVDKLKQALGPRFVGEYIGMSPHTPWNEVIDATKDALDKKADCIITIGGGSLVDGGKAMLLFMANNILTIPDILKFGSTILVKRGSMSKKLSEYDCVCPKIPLICIPTTLSGGEYTDATGGTDPDTHRKLVMRHPGCGPRLIINDPKLTITAPEWVWLSTGVRGVDHATEGYCRLFTPNEMLDKELVEAFRLLVSGLLKTKQEWTNEESRLECMLAVKKALLMLRFEVVPGGSHGIGHQLGPLGVGHGQTSCILLPSVMKYNAKVNREKQEHLKSVMWNEPAVREVFTKRGLREDSSDAADGLDAAFRELGMPRSLSEVGVGSDKFDLLAENSLTDPCAPTNPIPLERKEQVLEILQMCA